MTNEQRAALKQLMYEAATDQGLGVYDAELVSDAYGRIANWLEQNQWIPVTERLPETEGNYQVTTSDGEVSSWWFIFGTKRWLDKENEINVPLAWQERPAPYTPPKTENNG